MTSRLLCAAILTLVPVTGGALQADYAWWLKVTFVPKDTTIESIPVRQLDPSWVAASSLQDTELPAEASEPGESVQEHGGAFEVSHDLDGDGRVEKVLVGVYRADSGEVGRFVLVLSAGKRGGWEKRALFKEAGSAGFSVLFHQEMQLVWTFCMECDSYCELKSSRRKWKLKCHSCCEDI